MNLGSVMHTLWFIYVRYGTLRYIKTSLLWRWRHFYYIFMKIYVVVKPVELKWCNLRLILTYTFSLYYLYLGNTSSSILGPNIATWWSLVEFDWGYNVRGILTTGLAKAALNYLHNCEHFLPYLQSWVGRCKTHPGTMSRHLQSMKYET